MDNTHFAGENDRKHSSEHSPDNSGCDDQVQDPTPEAFTRLYSIIKTLRGPEGCPWDIKQTPQSLASNILEEAYEFIDALSNKDTPNMREELGDLYLLVTMISYMYEQNSDFTISDVLHEVCDKLVRRHPHVFGDMKKEDAGEVVELWDSIKKNVEKKEKVYSITEEVPRTLPPLERSYKLQKKASKAGFDWNTSSEVKKKVVEELKELIEVIESEEPAGKREEEELGDVLFSVVNLSRFLKIDPAIALHTTNQKFVRRFQYIEEVMKKEGKELTGENFGYMDKLWEEAKDAAE